MGAPHRTYAGVDVISLKPRRQHGRVNAQIMDGLDFAACRHARARPYSHGTQLHKGVAVSLSDGLSVSHRSWNPKCKGRSKLSRDSAPDPPLKVRGFFECLIGRQPFPASSLERQIAAHISEPPPNPSKLQPTDTHNSHPTDLRRRDPCQIIAGSFAGDAVTVAVQPRAVAGLAGIERCSTSVSRRLAVRVVHSRPACGHRHRRRNRLRVGWG